MVVFWCNCLLCWDDVGSIVAGTLHLRHGRVASARNGGVAKPLHKRCLNRKP